MVTKKLVYLACPYTHDDPDVMQWRFEMVNRAASKLMKEGLFVFSPISHTHPIALAGGLPKGWDYWEMYDRAVLESCRLMYVLQLPGWLSSRGVAAEIAVAKDLGLEIIFIEGEVVHAKD